MKMNFPFSIIVLCCFILTACEKQVDLYEQLNLHPTTYRENVIEGALENMNVLLKASSYKPLYLATDKAHQDGIPVLWVGDHNLSQTVSDMMYVSKQCACIVVQPRVFYDWIKDYNTVGEKDYSTDEDAQRLLEYLLLHEYGHIFHGHEGRAIEKDPEALNRVTTLTKEQEQLADDFASTLVSQYSKQGQPYEEWSRAINLDVALKSFSFTLAGRRMINNQGCSFLDAPCAFHDMGDTHFNMEYRILKSQCLMSGDLGYCDLLEEYEGRRESDGVFSGAPLYQSEDFDPSMLEEVVQ